MDIIILSLSLIGVFVGSIIFTLFIENKED